MNIVRVCSVAGVVLGAVSLCRVSPAQLEAEDANLAYSLGDHNYVVREAAVQRVLSLGATKIPLLLSWTEREPPHPPRLFLFGQMLRLSMAEVFAKEKTVAAIPFLLRNINIQELRPFDSWRYSPEQIASDYPAAGALIRIGPEAARAVIRAYPNLSGLEERLVAVFVVSQIGDVAEAREFFRFIRATNGPESPLVIWAAPEQK